MQTKRRLYSHSHFLVQSHPAATKRSIIGTEIGLAVPPHTGSPKMRATKCLVGTLNWDRGTPGGFDPAQVTDSPQVVVFRHCALTMTEPTDGAVVCSQWQCGRLQYYLLLTCNATYRWCGLLTAVWEVAPCKLSKHCPPPMPWPPHALASLQGPVVSFRSDNIFKTLKILVAGCELF